MPGTEDKMENNTNNSSYNDFDDLGAETRQYMAEHMGEFKTAGGGSIAEELRRFIEQDIEATADRPAVSESAAPEGAGEETRSFMAADEPADTPVHKDAEPLPRRGAAYQQRPGDQAPRRPVQSQQPQRRPVQEVPQRSAQEQPPQRRGVQQGAQPRQGQPSASTRQGQQHQYGAPQRQAQQRPVQQRQGGSAPPPPRARDDDEAYARHNRRKYVYIALASLAAVAIIAIALVVLLSGGGGDYDASYSRAMELYIDGDYASAISVLEETRRIADTEEAVILLARCHAALGDTETAASVLSGWLLTHDGAEAEAMLAQYSSAGEEDGSLTIGGQSVDPETDSLAISGTALTHAELESIGSLSNLRVLSLSDCAISDISALSRLTGLTSLTLTSNNIEDVSALRQLTSLRTLYLSGNRITDFSPLHSLTSLTTLDISGMEITEEQLEALQEALPNCAVISDEPTVEVLEITLGGVTFQSDVTELDLSGRGIDDISELAQCEGLEILNLSGNEISDLSPLVGLAKLRELDISDNAVSSLSPLMGLTTLEVLDASGNEISGTAALSGLTSLRELDLSSTGIGDSALSSLTGLSALRTLNLEENASLTLSGVESLRAALPDCEVLVSEELFSVQLGDAEFDTDASSVDASGANVRNLDGIERFTALTQLDLSDNPGLDIDGLGQMTGLTELILSGCGISGVGELGSLSSLVSLDLSDNPELSDIGALGLLGSLQTLDLGGTGVTDISVLADLPRLNTLILTGCEIEDFSVLGDFTSLEYLDLSDTGISRTELLWLSSALPGCTIYT